jgi:ketosteroid isomerase-like protein
MVRASADRAEVLDLVSICAISIDTKDWATVASCFTDDAEVDFGGRVGAVRGASAAAEVLRRTLDSLDSSQHMVANSVVRLNGDEATHIGYIHAQHRRGTELYTVGARYDDVLRRTEQGWKLCRRVVSRIWRAGDPNVIQPQ